jgi:PAS domain S-box-containing protein
VNTGFHRKILAGFLLALVTLILVVVQLHRNSAEFRSSQNQLANGHEVAEALQVFLTSAEDAETGRRGYVLTGDETYLRTYNRALSEIEASLQRTVNEAAAEALGYTIDELQGKNLCDLLVPQLRVKFEWYLKALIEWGAHSGLTRVQTKDGDEVVWSYSNRVIGGKGASPYVLGHAHDVTAQVAGADRGGAESERREAAGSARKRRRAYRGSIF